MNKIALLLLLFFCVQLRVNAQVKIGDNPNRINSASLLELEKSDRGLVFPRVSITDANRSDPLPLGVLNGTVIFNTNSNPLRGLEKGLYVWIDNKWVSMGGVFDWHLNGNAATNSDSNFIGTTDNASLSFRTNNIERMTIDSVGAISLGTQVKIGDNPTNINPASILELETTNKGFVFPR